MKISEAQADMRKAYFGGGPGAFVSGIIWLAAGITAVFSTQEISVLIFFFGGMLIHPLGMLVSKALKRSGKHTKGNPLTPLAMESTILLFVGLFIAYAVLQIQPKWFFSIMILIIGSRYLLFSSLYGMRIYYIFGGALIAAGFGGILLSPPFYLIGIVGGVIEILFSILIISVEPKFKSAVE